MSSPSIFDSPQPLTNAPEWFQQRQQQAWQRFLTTPQPKRGDEAWRFASIKQLDFSAVSHAREIPTSNDFLKQISPEATASLVFANGSLVHTNTSKLPPGVICLPLAQALNQHSELVRQHFMQQDTRLGSAKWTALHEANLQNGLFLFVPENTEISAPIEVFHWFSGQHQATFPHTLIIAANGSKVSVVEYFQSINPTDPHLVIAVNDLIAQKNSQLDYLTIQDLNPLSKVIQVNETGVSQNAKTKGFILNTGSAWARNESLCRLLGENSRSDMLSVSLATAQQEYDQRTFQHHISPGATSDLLYKNSLHKQARTIFSGLIFVDEGAHRTDAYQTCRNLLMSDNAEANSMPGLEINADDVKCSHGSTSSTISEEEIFYLRARGIDPNRARQLLARGFSLEVIHRLENPTLEAIATRFLDTKLHHINLNTQ